MVFVSKKRFREEVEQRVCEEMKRIDEMRWRDDREREMQRIMRDMENRLIRVEKELEIDHPSHNCCEDVRAGI